MVSTRTKSSGIQKSLVDQAIQILATLPDRSHQNPLESESSPTNFSQTEVTSH